MSYKVDWEKATRTKVTLPIIAVIALVVLGWRIDNWTVDYLSEFFITRAEATDQYETVTTQVAANAGLIKSHINEYQLNENAKALSRVADHIYDIKSFISVNGDSQLTRDRERDLNKEKDRLDRVRRCIIRDDKDENCSAIL